MIVSISSFVFLGPHILPYIEIYTTHILLPWLLIDAEFNSVHDKLLEKSIENSEDVPPPRWSRERYLPQATFSVQDGQQCVVYISIHSSGSIHPMALWGPKKTKEEIETIILHSVWALYVLWFRSYGQKHFRYQSKNIISLTLENWRIVLMKIRISPKLSFGTIIN